MATDPIQLSNPARKILVFDEKLSLFNPNLPLEESKAIPSLWYHDLEIYEAECRSVFGQSWVSVGRVGEVKNPKSYFQLQVAKEPVVVLKDENNTIRAFSNVCRHRATQLLTDTKGKLSVSMMKCQYHGWCYDLSGRLCKAPELGQVKGFSRKEYSLVPFEVESWGPLVFIRMQKGVEPLQAILAPLIKQNVKDKISELQWGGRKEYEVACNWKVYVDNYLDGGYHVPTIHPELDKTLDYKEYRTDVFDFCSLQHSPTKASDNSASTTRQGEAMYWWIFPNTMINIYEGVMDTNVVLPLGADRCKVIFDFYFDKSWEKASIKQYIKDADLVQLQDMEVCELVQSGLKSRFYNSGPYAKREIGEHDFHQLLAKQLQS